jgi:hypothetical protein
MSQFSGSPFAPLHQALIHPLRQRPGTTQYVPGVSDPDMSMGDEDSNRLQMAQNMAVARTQKNRGQSPTSQQSFSSGTSPIQKAVIAAKGQMLAQMTDLGDDEKEQYGKLQQDPNLSLQQFHQVLANRPKAAKPPKGGVHNFDAGEQPAADPNAGSMSIRQGDGKDGRQAMSAEAMQQWQQRIAEHGGLRGAEAVSPVTQSLRPGADASDPGVRQVAAYNQAHGTGDGTITNAGFDVTGMNGTAPAQQTGDPIVHMVQGYKQRMNPEQYSRFIDYAKSGATAPELHSFGESVLSGQDRNARQDDVREQTWDRQDDRSQAVQDRRTQAQSQRQIMQAKNKRLGDLRRQNQQMRKDPSVLWDSGDESQFAGNDPETQRLHKSFTQYHQNEQEMTGLEGELEKGYDQKPDSNSLDGIQASSQPAAQHGQYQVGQTINTPKGAVKVVGLDHDGHPLIQPLGK